MGANKGFTRADYLEAYERLGTYRAVAREFGVCDSTVREVIARAKRASDPAMQNAMDAVGTGLVPSVAWIKTKATADTPGFSVMLRPPDETPEEVADRVAARMNNIVAAPAVPAPAACPASTNLIPK